MRCNPDLYILIQVAMIVVRGVRAATEEKRAENLHVTTPLRLRLSLFEVFVEIQQVIVDSSDAPLDCKLRAPDRLERGDGASGEALEVQRDASGGVLHPTSHVCQRTSIRREMACDHSALCVLHDRGCSGRTVTGRRRFCYIHVHVVGGSAAIQQAM